MPCEFPRLVVFDLDGTLIDSSLDLCLSVNAALHSLGLPALSDKLIASYIGEGAATLMRRSIAKAQGLEPPASDPAQQARFDQGLAFFLNHYREHKLDNTRLYDGVRTSLDAIRSDMPELPMAVLTNKPVGASRELCAALGIAPFFLAIYGGNSFPTKKPDPTGLLHLCAEAAQLREARGVKATALNPATVLMVGDSAVDVLTARRAGARCLGCRYGLAPESLTSTPPDWSCDTPHEWPTLFAQLGGRSLTLQD